MTQPSSAKLPLDPATLRSHYHAFLRPGRVLLTGHSHQAWPDVARDAMVAAFDDAAELVDDKWQRAFEAADAVRDGLVERLGGARHEYALASNTHELVTRFLSALDLTGRRRHLVTTAGEFHTIHRQLRRLSEAGVEVTWVEPQPVATLTARLADAVRDDTAAVLLSTVLFESSSVVPDLSAVITAAHRHGAQVLLDAYHGAGVVRFRVEDLGPGPVFVVGGGYKYLQWGEGVCFLRVPDTGGAALRPVYTGWFADFAHLADRRVVGPVAYGATGAEQFAGSTYDPTSHYRARAVIDFFRTQGLTSERVTANYRRQTARLLGALAEWNVVTPGDDGARGGFVAVRVTNAAEVVAGLRDRGILVDARGDIVRLGPAPYTTDAELDAGAAAMAELAHRG